MGGGEHVIVVFGGWRITMEGEDEGEEGIRKKALGPTNPKGVRGGEGRGSPGGVAYSMLMSFFFFRDMVDIDHSVVISK